MTPAQLDALLDGWCKAMQCDSLTRTCEHCQLGSTHRAAVIQWAHAYAVNETLLKATLCAHQPVCVTRDCSTCPLAGEGGKP